MHTGARTGPTALCPTMTTVSPSLLGLNRVDKAGGVVDDALCYPVSVPLAAN